VKDQVPEEFDRSGEGIEAEIDDLTRKVETRARRETRAEKPETQRPSTLKRALNSPVIAGGLVGIAVVLTAFNLLFTPGLRRHPEPRVEDRIEATLRFAEEEISAFVEDEGRLPEGLAEIGLDAKAEMDYEVLPDGRCRLVVHMGDRNREEVFSPLKLGQEGKEE